MQYIIIRTDWELPRCVQYIIIWTGWELPRCVQYIIMRTERENPRCVQYIIMRTERELPRCVQYIIMWTDWELPSCVQYIITRTERELPRCVQSCVYLLRPCDGQLSWQMTSGRLGDGRPAAVSVPETLGCVPGAGGFSGLLPQPCWDSVPFISTTVPRPCYRCLRALTSASWPGMSSLIPVWTLDGCVIVTLDTLVGNTFSSNLVRG